MTVILTAPTLRFVKLHSFKKIFCVTIPMLKKIWLFSFFFFFLTPKEGKKKKKILKKALSLAFVLKNLSRSLPLFFLKKKKMKKVFQLSGTELHNISIFFFFFPLLEGRKKKEKKENVI